jgi:membrane protease YdiL (CAAX protease family)
MMLEWMILCLLIILPIAAAISGKRKKDLQPPNRIQFYFKDIMASVLILTVFFVLKPSLYHPLDFSTIDKGIEIDDLVASAIPIFLIPFVLSFTRWSNDYPKDITGAKELFGYPVSYLPNTGREYSVFFCYIIVGVFFEELTCRQFLFRSLDATLHLNGDLLVVASSLLFAIGHLYQGWKGILSGFVAGLVFGKIFLIKESLVYPIVVHLFLNLTIVVLAFRRIKDLRKINRNPQDVGLTG